MNLPEAISSKVTFPYSRHAMFPQIPVPNDVLYALRLTETSENYALSAGNFPEYLRSVHFVAALIAPDVHAAWNPAQPKPAQMMIAEAIVQLMPESAKCLFVSSYMTLQKILGKVDLPRGADRVTRMQICGCSSCTRTLARESDLRHDRL